MRTADSLPRCTLTEPVCDDRRCHGCGWEEHEYKRRVELLRAEGFTKDKYGRRYLSVKKEGGN